MGLAGRKQLGIAAFEFFQFFRLKGRLARQVGLQLVQLRLFMIELFLPLLQSSRLRLGPHDAIASLFLLPRELVRNAVELTGNAGFQIAQALALTGDPLTNAAALLVDGLTEGLSPCVRRRRLAKRFFHVDNPRREYGGGSWPGD
jgi:hypothetical protein